MRPCFGERKEEKREGEKRGEERRDTKKRTEALKTSPGFFAVRTNSETLTICP